MDPALLALATSSANALVSLMTTDLWERAKSGVSGIFSTWSSSSEAVDQELDSSRSELLDSRSRGDMEETSQEMQQLWTGKFRRLLLKDPEAAQDLRIISELLAEASGKTGSSDVINQIANARDNARIYQQGSGVQYNG